jgi:3-hydroxyacyl-CoA dehydrogenase/enoyl-CoA hydratase/3-hydroxybutyryl-CoA epimerase
MSTQARTPNGALALDFDAQSGIATLTLDMPKVNIINEAFGLGLREAMDWAESRDALRGIIIASAHRDFCAGADLDSLHAETDPARLALRVAELSSLYRRIETSKVPVVAALTGTALGGGYELALACHRRVAVDDARAKFGLPEVQLGVMPGAGGTQRLPRLIGVQAALELILQGSELRAPKALAKGLVDELAPNGEAVIAAAMAWIAENPTARQPWDNRGFRMPGPRPTSSDGRNIFMAACAMLTKKTSGVFHAPQRAISAIQEGSALGIEAGLAIEARYFVELALGAQAKDMIRTLWFYRNAANKHEGLPRAEASGFERIAVLGAGMMGAGLAYVCAKAGFEVWLKDIDADALSRGVAHFESDLAKLKHLDEKRRAQIRARLHPTLELDEMQNMDLIIEAVFEDLELKHRVTRETQVCLSPTGVWASNTSAIPIGDLAEPFDRPDDFVGLHFFSPVEKMPLLEIIKGERTSEDCLARCLHFCRAISKLPIVVNDGYAFYTSRVFSAYILEGAQLVAEGYDPELIEWAARQAGMVVPPLQVFDEVTLTLGIKALKQSRKYLERSVELEGVELLEAMVNQHERKGRSSGAGFYDYEAGRRVRLWPGLRELGTAREESRTARELVVYLADRLLLTQCVQAANCVAEKIIERARDAEVGGVFGIGFAPNTGGPLTYMQGRGLAAVVSRLDEFAETVGPRYLPPDHLRELAAENGSYLQE